MEPGKPLSSQETARNNTNKVVTGWLTVATEGRPIVESPSVKLLGININNNISCHNVVTIAKPASAMWRWAFLSLWCSWTITCVIGSPSGPSPESGPGPGGGTEVAWRCPEIAEQPIVECSCDMPHTLRCTGDKTAIGIVARLRSYSRFNDRYDANNLFQKSEKHQVDGGKNPKYMTKMLHGSDNIGIRNEQVQGSPYYQRPMKEPSRTGNTDWPKAGQHRQGRDIQKRLHGKHRYHITKDHIDEQQSYTWLQDGQLLPETESFMLAIEDQKLASPLQALGLPNNKLEAVPTEALAALPELDRLALSGNKMVKLDGGSFKGLRNLSFIDLSDNVISKIAPNTFSNIPQLRILRLRGNKLTIFVISKLNPLPTLEELDLSDNALVGPVGPKTLPRMEALRDLQLSHNTLSSIKMGALQGLMNLTSLRLQHNQIDVIEDHAFINLGSLIVLDLAHNRIVAVSGASLAHLTKLTDLDLRHNFLRALTPDLVQPLKSLKTVLLDDNEISIVASDALKPTTLFKHFTLSENPLNCDCSLSDFAAWLNNSTLTNEDKSTAICTTPPSLENGLLIEVSPESLECGEDEQDSLMPPLAAQSSFKARINLNEFQYDGSNIKLQWGVEDETTPYTCDAIFVYEEEGQNEVLVETNPLKCNSSELVDPKVLNVTVPNISDLQELHRAISAALKGADLTIVGGSYVWVRVPKHTPGHSPESRHLTSPLPGRSPYSSNKPPPAFPLSEDFNAEE
nr:unnamed protein product [Callosobruchus analis]